MEESAGGATLSTTKGRMQCATELQQQQKRPISNSTTHSATKITNSDGGQVRYTNGHVKGHLVNGQIKADALLDHCYEQTEGNENRSARKHLKVHHVAPISNLPLIGNSRSSASISKECNDRTSGESSPQPQIAIPQDGSVRVIFSSKFAGELDVQPPSPKLEDFFTTCKPINYKILGKIVRPHIGSTQAEKLDPRCLEEWASKIKAITAHRVALIKDEPMDLSSPLRERPELPQSFKSEDISMDIEDDEIIIHPEEIELIDYADLSPQIRAKLKAHKAAQDNRKSDQIRHVGGYTFEEYFYAEYDNFHRKAQQYRGDYYIECSDCLVHLKLKRFGKHLVDHHLFDYGHPGLLCTHCMKMFETADQYDEHIRLLEDITAFKYSCLICFISFDDDQSRMEHIRENHFQYTMPYVCQICDYRSSLMVQFVQHMTSYHQRACCHFCLLPFKSSSYVHECSSTVGNHCPYLATKSLNSNIKLTQNALQHYALHLLVKNKYKCQRCTLSFLVRHDLDQHMIHDHTLSWGYLEENSDRMVLQRFHFSEEQSYKVAVYEDLEVLERAIGETIRRDGKVLKPAIVKEENENDTKTDLIEPPESLNPLNQPPTVTNSPAESSSTLKKELELAKLEQKKAECNQLYFQDLLVLRADVRPYLTLTLKNLLSVTIHRYEIVCFECNSELCVSNTEAKQELTDHFCLTKPDWVCDFPECKYKSRCSNAHRYHMHGLGTRMEPTLMIAPNFQPRNLPNHLTICVTCGIRSNSAMEMVYHMNQNHNHIGFTAATETPEEANKETAVKTEEHTIPIAEQNGNIVTNGWMKTEQDTNEDTSLAEIKEEEQSPSPQNVDENVKTLIGIGIINKRQAIAQC